MVVFIDKQSVIIESDLFCPQILPEILDLGSYFLWLPLFKPLVKQPAGTITAVKWAAPRGKKSQN